jgi:hypothetical protein
MYMCMYVCWNVLECVQVLLAFAVAPCQVLLSLALHANIADNFSH